MEQFDSSVEESFKVIATQAILLWGVKVPRNERARERKFPGANWPGSYWPIHSRERIGPGAKRL